MTDPVNPPLAPSSRSALHRLLEHRYGGVVLFAVVYLALALFSRCALLARATHEVSWDASLPAAFGWGLLFDLGAGGWFSLPLIVLLTLLPAR